MTEFEYQQVAARIEHQVMSVVGKVSLIVIGLIIIIGTALSPNLKHLWVWQACGAIPLVLALYWIITDKLIPTQEEEIENLLIEVSRKMKEAGSIARLVEEYRANGADDLTLSRILGAPRVLRERARSKLSAGIMFSAAGLILGMGGAILMMWQGGPLDKHFLKYGFLGAGLGMGYIAQGLRFKWYARRFSSAKKPPVIHGAAQMPDAPVTIENTNDQEIFPESKVSMSDQKLFSVGDCPACPGSGDVLVLHAIHSNKAVFYCPACETAWDYRPDPHELNEVRVLTEVAPSGVRLPTDEEVANLNLAGVRVIDFDRWASALNRIVGTL